MIRRAPLELPPSVANAFVSATRDYFAELDNTKQDAIAAHQLDVLRLYQSPQEKKLRLSDVKAMFLEIKRSIK
jgi:hypothetical protein